MDVSKIAIQIASEFTGSKAFKQAETSTQKLQRQVQTLGRTLGLALGTAAIVKFGKASVKAFAQDDNAARSLTKTLENLGLNTRYAGDALNGYISRLEKQTGVLDDELRPAMDRLLRATGSVTKSQELLNLALDIAAGTGKDLTTVSQALQKAYLGNNASLGRLGVGLSKAELTSSSFLQIQDRLTKLFAGQATDAANSFQGSLNKLTAASNNAKEAIGKGLVDALTILGGSNSGGVTGAVGVIDKMSNGIATGTKNIAFMIKQFEKLKPVILIIGAALLIAFAPVTAAVAALAFVLAKGGENLRKASFAKGIIPGGAGGLSSSMSVAGQTENVLGRKQRLAMEAGLKTNKETLKTDKARLDALKKITAEQNKKLALDKASAFLNQAQKLFDQDRIQLAAAAMSKQSDEDKVRIRLKQEIMDLEDAINEGNVEGAAKLAVAISKDAELLGQLRGDMIKLGDVPNPFAIWLATLQQIAAQLLALAQIPLMGSGLFNIFSAVPGSYSTGGGTAGGNLGSDVYQSTLTGQALINKLNKNDAFATMATGGIVNKATMALIGEAGPEAVIPLDRMGSMGGTTVIVNVSGSVTTERDLVSAITQGIYNNQASGIPISYSTVY
jgi:hypothetical protein